MGEYIVIEHMCCRSYLFLYFLLQMSSGIDVPDVYNATASLPLTEDAALIQYRSLVNHCLLAMKV